MWIWKGNITLYWGDTTWKHKGEAYKHHTDFNGQSHKSNKWF